MKRKKNKIEEGEQQQMPSSIVHFENTAKQSEFLRKKTELNLFFAVFLFMFCSINFFFKLQSQQTKSMCTMIHQKKKLTENSIFYHLSSKSQKSNSDRRKN